MLFPSYSRSLFYGELLVAVRLLSDYSANASLADHEGLTPIDHAHLDSRAAANGRLQLTTK